MKVNLVIGIAAVAFMTLRYSIFAGSEITNQFPSGEVQFNRANPKMIWGETTNFLRGDYMRGVTIFTSLRSAVNVHSGTIVLSGDSLRLAYPANLYMENCQGPLYLSAATVQGVPSFSTPATNLVTVYLPPVQQRLILTMFDSNGAAVTKTPEGRALGQPLGLKPGTQWTDLPRAGTGRKGMFSLFPREPYQIAFSDEIGAGIALPYSEVKIDWEFNPARYFKLEQVGVYKLSVTLRVYVEGTNAFLKAITLPPVTVPVRVEK